MLRGVVPARWLYRSYVWAHAWKWGLAGARLGVLNRFFVMVGTQRTGTTMLRELLATNLEIGFEGEIFTPADDGPSAFERFQAAHGLGRPANYPEAERQLATYLKEVHSRLPDTVRAFGIDVKYSQLRGIVPRFEPLSASPMLVQFMVMNGTRVLHVVRGNVLQSALSEVIAAARQVWHHRRGETIDRQVTVDCRYLIRIMEEKAADRRIFETLIDENPLVLTCEYERMVEGVNQADEAGMLVGPGNPIFEIADFLGVSRRFRRRPEMRKVIERPYAEIVANYRQVTEAVRRSEFAFLLDTI